MAGDLLTPASLRLLTLSTASRKEGEEKRFSNPLSTFGEERVIQRSVDGVSKLYERYQAELNTINKTETTI
jgi:hypothetical protein